ncbi:MAG: response regulator [Thermoanaerobaculia bacterium]|nr:response regulator [Thermoanaerobaculia bacterium]
MEDFVLIVDDEPSVRALVASQLQYLGLTARHTGDHEEALAEVAGANPPSLVMLDIEMPRISGMDLLRQIKQIDQDVQVVMVSGLQDLGTVRECLRAGAYDYLAKPFELEDLSNTTERALERRQLIRENRDYQRDLEHMVEEQTEEIRRTRDIALMTLAKLAESRDSETGLHLERMQEYSRLLADNVRDGPYANEIDDEFVEWVFKSAPLHDIGKVGIADSILRKPGPLTPEELETMRTHTTIGGDTLRSVLKRFRGPTFLTMAMEIAYSHHERWDGGGYPAGLAQEQIPLAARIVAVADAYDAITSPRPYKQSIPHTEAVERIRVDRGLHFDPILVDTFLACADRFDEVRQEMMDARSAERASAAAARGAA